MVEWTGTKRQPDNKIKTERNQGRSDRKRLTSGKIKDRGREEEKTERKKGETRNME